MPFLGRFGALASQTLASDIGRRLAGGAFWSLMASLASRSCALLASILVARLLGKEGFGQLGILQSTVDMFGTVAGFGMGLTSTKYVAEYRSKDAEKAGRIIAMSSVVAWVCGGIGAVVLALLSPWLAKNAIAAPQLASLLRVTSISLVFGAVSGAQVGALSGFEAFRKIAYINVVAGVLTFIFRVSGAVTMGLEGAVYGMLLAQAAGCGINFFALRGIVRKAGIPIRLRGFWKESSVLWKFSLPTVLGSLVALPATWVCSAMLVNQRNGYAEMGLFNAANQWLFVILFLPSLMGQAAMPVLFEQLSLGNHRKAAKVFTALVRINAIVLAPLALVGCFSKVIMSFYGPGFASGWPTMLLTLLTAGIMAVQMPAGYVLAAKNKMWLTLVMNAGWGVTFIGLNFLLLHWGAEGMASARLGAVCVHALATSAYAYHSLKQDSKEPTRAVAPIVNDANILQTKCSREAT